MKINFTKSLFLIISVLIIFTECGKDTPRDNSLKNIKEKGYFIVGLDDKFPPMGFRSQDDYDVLGFDIDLAKETARRLGIKVQFKNISWNDSIISLNRGDIDVIWNGLSITEEKEEKILFSKPYLNNRRIVMIRNDSNIKRLSEFNGKTIGFLREIDKNTLDSNLSFFRDFKEFKNYDSLINAFTDLSIKKIDALITDEIAGKWYMAVKPGFYRILDEDLGEECYGVGIRKTDLSFKEELDRILDEIKRDQKGEEISKKWFGTNILLK